MDNNQNPFQNANIKTPDMTNLKKIVRRFLPPVLVLIFLAILAANSIYTLNTGEEAVITRFGRHVNTERTYGLKFKLPFIETAHIVNVAGVRRMEFGFREHDTPASEEVILAEALMLTGEESRVNGLVIADWVIQYRISDSFDFLFRVQDPVATLRSVTQAVYRRVAAANPLDAILTYRKDDIQREVLIELQELSRLYRLGIEITAVQLQEASPPDEVREAFLDVTRALEDRQSKINEAQRYRDEEIPRARGRAAAVVNEAEAYSVRRVNEAQGSVARYLEIQAEYHNQRDITRTRLYLEMIREVLPRAEKVYFVDQNNGGLLEILHLGQGGGN